MKGNSMKTCSFGGDIIDESKERIVQHIKEACRINSINPQFGGPGEAEIVKWLQQIFDNANITYNLINCEDNRVVGGKRPSLWVKFQAESHSDKTTWFIAHLDTVSPGDLSFWKTDPFEPVVSEGKIFGLGAEDNCQAIAVLLEICLLIQEKRIVPKTNCGFLIMRILLIIL